MVSPGGWGGGSGDKVSNKTPKWAQGMEAQGYCFVLRVNRRASGRFVFMGERDTVKSMWGSMNGRRGKYAVGPFEKTEMMFFPHFFKFVLVLGCCFSTVCWE